VTKLGNAPPVGVAVDVVVLTVREHRLEVLLARLAREPFAGKWALPGGRIRLDETVEAAAVRELSEKTGLVGEVFLEQLYTFSDPHRDPSARCVSVAHLALVPPDASLRIDDKYSAVGWFTAHRPPSLGYDHRQILAYAVKRLQAKLEYTNVAYSLLPEQFSLGDLQEIYQVILGQTLDARNFQRRVKELGLVEETGDVRRGERHRPARLYRFRQRRPMEVAVLT